MIHLTTVSLRLIEDTNVLKEKYDKFSSKLYNQ